MAPKRKAESIATVPTSLSAAATTRCAAGPTMRSKLVSGARMQSVNRHTHAAGAPTPATCATPSYAAAACSRPPRALPAFSTKSSCVV